RLSRAELKLTHLPADHATHVLPLEGSKAESLTFDINHGHYPGGREAGLAEAWRLALLQEQQRVRDQLAADRQQAALERAKNVAAAQADKDSRIAELEKALSTKILLDNPVPEPPAF